MNDDARADEEATPPAEPIRLLGGVNFTTWPDLKWSRGNSHVATLQSKFGEWQASAPVSVDAVLREDRMGIDLVARVPKGIPKHEWSLDLGDALHNLRSAFDAVAWGMAHFKDAEPARPKSVYFPICTEEKQWKKAVSDWVGEIDPELQERLRLMQPFTYVPAGQVSLLSILHDLDIQDKHRDILTVTADLEGVNLGGSFQYEDPATPALPRVEMKNDVKFGDGVVLGTIHAGTPIQMVGQMILRPAIKVQLIHEDKTFDVVPMLQQLVQETRRYLDILLFGLASTDENEGEWSPMEVGPPPT
ncbi:hypothetical protein ABRP18_001155 [Microbacterium sp. WHRI 7836]|uniref:hypothetical protein n=1 Tax=Microbacterium sp. WHRI 7836 TaxID=3162563 RepID=UPI0032EE8DB0